MQCLECNYYSFKIIITRIFTIKYECGMPIKSCYCLCMCANMYIQASIRVERDDLYGLLYILDFDGPLSICEVTIDGTMVSPQQPVYYAEGEWIILC